jgi:alpha/beta superfamily hydrolase
VSAVSFIFVVLSASAVIAAETDKNMSLEQSVCGLKEPLLFWVWSSAAGRPNARRVKELDYVKDISFPTLDGRELRGYALLTPRRDSAQAGKRKGYLLVLQGNAQLADQIIGELTSYVDAGYDVYIYDYRGYGRSNGKRRLKAMVSDVGEIIAELNSSYDQRLVYAMSFGGILFLNALGQNIVIDRAVIDSSPSRLSTYGCPVTYDPITHVPADGSQLMFIVGLRDTVVTPSMSEEMIDLAQQRKAEVVIDSELAHPFMDYGMVNHRRRMAMIQRFLIGQ